MENRTIQEQIKDTFENKLRENDLFTNTEVDQICELLYQKTPAEKLANSIYQIIGGELVENTPT